MSVKFPYVLSVNIVLAHIFQGPIFTMWENTLEKLKLLDYENSFCSKKRSPFNRVHFVFPAANPSEQFDEFVDLCAWLFFEISQSSDIFKRDQFDDPNTVANKILLALRQFDFRSSFPVAKLRQAHGEPACTVLEFLVDCALEKAKIGWGMPMYPASDEGAQDEPEDDEEEKDEIEDEVEGTIDDDLFFQENTAADGPETSLDTSAHHMLTSHIDPVAWKTELERVGPKLKSQQHMSLNEWRAHVDQTVTSKAQIEQVLSNTQGDLKSLNRYVADDTNKMSTREKYINNQFVSVGKDFKEIKQKLEALEVKSGAANEVTTKLMNELAEISERADEMKDTLESKDSGIHDASPLVRMKSALQHIKSEVFSFDLRVGVISNTLLASRIHTLSQKKVPHHKKHRRHWKNHHRHHSEGKYDDDSYGEEY